ncbi:helix-turn-helix domain-containing protein [Streptomyces sp. NPDC046465]|uniref:TetR/AcrR family transcriptional regulator n=1 Tax=Streptomyces sp. NPDC046465 TaxID=3155810 RepID=UPI00340DA12C
MTGSGARPRSDTRRQILEVALELFAARGYERTSLREIAERLGVTKAAVYHHFKTKEEITVSLCEILTRPIEELIEWGRRQPPTPEVRQQLVRRYGRSLADAAPLHRFLQENQATVRDLRIGDILRDQLRRVHDLLVPAQGDLVDRVRCLSALLTLQAGMCAFQAAEGDVDQRHAAVIEVAVDLVAQAHAAGRIS